MNANHKKTLERVYQLFRTCPDPGAVEKGGGWSVKEILGHLVDSASNNHQRLARYVPKGNLNFPGYDQEQSVKRAGYREFDFKRLLSLWYNYNQLLLNMFAGIPAADLDSTITIGDRPPVAIRQLILDYFTHMENHERQARQVIAG